MTEKTHPAIGKYCVVRGYSFGVHAGIVSGVTDSVITLTESRRLWRWAAKESISLSSVAAHGIDYARSRVAPEVTVHLERRDACEIIEASDEARALIKGAPDDDQR